MENPIAINSCLSPSRHSEVENDSNLIMENIYSYVEEKHIENDLQALPTLSPRGLSYTTFRDINLKSVMPFPNIPNKSSAKVVKVMYSFHA